MFGAVTVRPRSLNQRSRPANLVFS